MIERTSVKARLFRKISKDNSDYVIILCSSKDYGHIPPSVKKDSTYITITGNNLPVIEGVEIQFFGEWVNNKKYGWQFNADSYSYVTPTTEKGIINFLKSKAFEGIGKKTAESIVEMFGKDTIDVIKHEPKKLLQVKGISPTKLGTIIESFKRNESFSELSIFLSSYEVSSENIVKINSFFGSDSVSKIKSNPYIIQDIKGIGFKTCDKIARGLNIALDSYERIKGAILEVSRKHVLLTGDTCISVVKLESETLNLLNYGINPNPVNQDIFRSCAKKLAQEGEIVFRGGVYCLTKEYDYAEELSAKVLNHLLKRPVNIPLSKIDKEINQYQNDTEKKLSLKQMDAVRLALSNRISVITGGPGTGKTTILKAIVECYKNLFPDGEIVLLSPTGKAARRMSEATGYVAKTIHSKLGLFENHMSDVIPLPKGLIVVDESSMVDTIVASKLLKAISPNSHLLFVGDIDQLPSISAGSVLKDMIDSGVIPVAKLEEIFRQKDGCLLIENARKINRGDKELIYNDDFIFVPATEKEALGTIKNVYEEETKRYGIDNVALLTPLRRSQNGRYLVVADEINKLLQSVINPKVNDDFCVLQNTEFHVNDRVMQWKNTELSSNGDIGIIQSIKTADGDISVDIKWDNGNCTTENKKSMSDITLAYAMSIHKSQGSEYQCCIIPLLDSQICQIFKRNLLYTAVTRAKKKVIIVGGKKAIETCIKTSDTNCRTTLFKERLALYKDSI